LLCNKQKALTIILLIQEETEIFPPSSSNSFVCVMFVTHTELRILIFGSWFRFLLSFLDFEERSLKRKNKL
jgi:hypothetical protein